MANRPKGFGMTAELARKKEAKFDAELANDCFEWMRLVLKDGNFTNEADSLKVKKILSCLLGRLLLGLFLQTSLWR